MIGDRRLIALIALLAVPLPARACEPVVPFMQVVAPTLALSGSLLMLALAVVVKSVLFAAFEPSLPRLQAAWRMLLGNVLTSIVGLLVAAMIANIGAWIIGVPLVALLCWLPARRLVQVSPLAWLRRVSPAMMAVLLTLALLVSCVLFAGGRGALDRHRIFLYWSFKLVAIFMALFASVSLTTIWEEWVIWRLSARPAGRSFFAAALRANLYVLILVLAVPAAMILPKRLKSPDFLAKRPPIAVGTASAPSR